MFLEKTWWPTSQSSLGNSALVNHKNTNFRQYDNLKWLTMTTSFTQICKSVAKYFTILIKKLIIQLYTTCTIWSWVSAMPSHFSSEPSPQQLVHTVFGFISYNLGLWKGEANASKSLCAQMFTMPPSSGNPVGYKVHGRLPSPHRFQPEMKSLKAGWWKTLTHRDGALVRYLEGGNGKPPL